MRPRWTTKSGLSMAAGFIALVLVGHGSPVRASCLLPEPAIVWSYPSEGASDVPVNAHLFLLLNTFGGPTTLSLNGVTVTSHEGLHFDPGPLAPNTAYLVTTTTPGPAGPVTLELRFTTGTGSAPAVGVPTLGGIVLDSFPYPSQPQTCPAVLNAQDCFDTGQDTIVRADASASDVVLWHLETLPAADAGPVEAHLRARWPAVCGPPVYVTHRERLEANPVCTRVTAVGADGQRLSSNLVCPDEPTPSGCSAAPTSRTSGVGFAALLLALTARFIRRRERSRASSYLAP